VDWIGLDWIRIQNGFTFLVPAYPGFPGKRLYVLQILAHLKSELAALKLPQWSQQQQLSVPATRRRRPSMLEPQRQTSGDRPYDRPCCVVLQKPVEKITVTCVHFSVLTLIALFVLCDARLGPRGCKWVSV